MITVAAIDDDRMLLGGLQAWLAPIADMDFMSAATSVERHLQLTAQRVPDVVLLDLNLRDGSSPAANVTTILATGTRVLVVSTIPDGDGVLATIEAGASGATLGASARRAGVAYGTAREYLERVKRKYANSGRPAHTKLNLAGRVREDRLELDGLQQD